MFKKNICFACMILLTCFFLYAQDDSEKPIIAVLDFESPEVSSQEMTAIISLISSALFQTGNYMVIDVSQRENLLTELQFSSSGCSDDTCMLEIGRLLSAENIVIGSIGTVGSRIILNAKILETESSRTLSSADGIYGSLDALIDDMQAFIRRLDYRNKGIEVVKVPTPERESKPESESPLSISPGPELGQEDPPENLSPSEAVEDPNQESYPKSEGMPFPVLFASTLGGGIVSAGVGAYFLITTLPLMIDYWGAQIDYNNAASGTESAYYTLYEAARDEVDNTNARNKFIMGSVLTGSGLIFGGISFLFFPESDSAAVAHIETRPDMLSFRIQY
ncbi:MAG: hypothetical protein JEY99_21165 [Spirochaetales bacterium]|nr:hypothetical protein [Spirochaetales bacterium]